MKRKNIFALLFSIAMLCVALYPAGSLAEQNHILRGLVTEVLENGLLLSDPEMGEVLLNVDPETVLEGVLAEKPLEKGMYVLARFNGNLTRTSPPQAHADRLGCYLLEGTVAEMLPGGVLLTGDPTFGEVIVHLSDAMPHVFTGVPMTIYYDGAMAMSLPGKVTAQHIDVPVIRGTVKSMAGDSLTLDTGEGEALTIGLSASSLVPASWFDESIKGRAVIIYHNGVGEEEQLIALEVVDPASIVEGSMPLDDSAEPEDAEETAGLEEGDEDTHTPELEEALEDEPESAEEDGGEGEMEDEADGEEGSEADDEDDGAPPEETPDSKN